MLLVSRYIRKMPKTATSEEFMRGVTAYIRKHYKKSMLQRLTEHPEDRLTCSAVIFSRLNREIWMIGDCQCMINGELFDNPKPAEAELAAMRAEEVKRLLATGVTQDELLRNDIARPVIIPHMLETMRQQNISYSVIDGFTIDRRHVRIIPLDFRPWEIVLASDGYPVLCPTLEESEQQLQKQREEDPLNIGTFQATKAFHPDFYSFDDRSYVRLKVYTVDKQLLARLVDNTVRLIESQLASLRKVGHTLLLVFQCQMCQATIVVRLSQMLV